VIVTDGYCPLRGTHAPLADYASCAAAGNGLLIVDDTQALGVFGRPAEPVVPYGSGGGGSLRRQNLRDSGIVVVSSLAKAFGVPVAMLGGSREFVQSFRENSATLVHCSPPSAAAISATLRALRLNRRSGDILRRRSLMLQPGPVAENSVVKIAQTFRSGTNDIDQTDFLEMFLEDEDQTCLETLSDFYVLVPELCAPAACRMRVKV